jgi:hypothetical protein
VDRERKRIALGLKQMATDPWEGDIPGRYRPGELAFLGNDLQGFQGKRHSRRISAGQQCEIARLAFNAFFRSRLQGLMELREPTGVELFEVPLQGRSAAVEQLLPRYAFFFRQSEQGRRPRVRFPRILVPGRQGVVLVAFHKVRHHTGQALRSPNQDAETINDFGGNHHE